MVLASLGALIGLALLLGGLALIAAHAFARDDDGYYTTDRERLKSPAYAIATSEIDLGTDPVDWTPEDLLGTVRIRVEGPSGRPTFLGIGRDVDVDRYLRGVRYSELTDFPDGEPRYDLQPGRAPARSPGAENFWVAESQGVGERTLHWEAESGVWSVVVMNANSAPGVSVEADVGAKVDWLIWVGVGLAVVGLVLAAGGVILIVVVGRRASRDRRPASPTPA
jgi:hypothetical protein